MKKKLIRRYRPSGTIQGDGIVEPEEPSAEAVENVKRAPVPVAPPGESPLKALEV